jgi:hypothetical protein
MRNLASGMFRHPFRYRGKDDGQPGAFACILDLHVANLVVSGGQNHQHTKCNRLKEHDSLRGCKGRL